MKEAIVVKCGGSVLARLSDTFFSSLQKLKAEHDLVVVHGGGPEIDEMLTKLNIPVEKKNGLRVTTKDVLQVVEMILCGMVNKNLVARFEKNGASAVGLSGCDGKLLEAAALNEELGYVGDVKAVNVKLLQSLLSQELVPVVSPVGMDTSGQLYNINGDTAAGAIASSLGAKQLLFVTDVPGVLHNGELIREANEELLANLIEEGVITGGMIPKVKAALASLQGEVEQVIIVDGLKGFIDENGAIIGTTVTKGVKAG